MAESPELKDFKTLPHTCVCIDAEVKHFMRAAKSCISGSVNRAAMISDLEKMFTTDSNPNPAMVTLSVRTAFDLFLQVKKYPPGSQIIMSAINIPDMVHIVKHHKLKPVPLDVSIENMSPKAEILENLINDKTVAIIVAHIYGKWINMEPFIETAQKYNLALIEDCAEVFCGFERLGNPQSDISLFSFGVIKNNTSFGGSIAKIKETAMYEKMTKLNGSYPLQSHTEYLKKLIKCLVAFTFLHVTMVTRPAMYLARMFNIDHKKKVVGLLRGFPNKLMQKLRHQPCDALIKMFWERMTEFDEREITLGTVKGDYVCERLPDQVICVGQKADVNNYWLFPVLVPNPDRVLKILNALGIDAYRGATQLNLIEPENGNTPLAFLHKYLSTYPHEAKYMLDHVIYLPVNKLVPFHDLDLICAAVDIAVAHNDSSIAQLRQVVKPTKLLSKL